MYYNYLEREVIIVSKRVYWNTESFKNKVNELTDGNYSLLGEYTKTHEKTSFKHIKCGTEFEMSPHNFLAGQRCPHCGMAKRKKGRRKSNEQFVQEVAEITNGEYKVVSPYKNNKTKVEFIHMKCGYHFKMKPNSFLSGQRCPKCGFKHRVKLRTMTNEEFLSRAKDVWGDEYTILGPYVNSGTLIKVRHNKCGNTYMTRPADFLRGHGCLKCSYIERSPKIGVNQRTPLAKVKENINKILGDQYIVLTKADDYKGNRQHIRIKHLICGHTYKARYSDIQHSHTGCPYCAKLGGPSNGELKIINILEKVYKMIRNYNFYYGYVVPNLKYKNNLHFDFWLPKYKLAIEYDGIQHFYPVNYFGGVEGFREQKYRDKLKDKYCKEHHISLLRIPYTISTNKEINDILSSYLCGHK